MDSTLLFVFQEMAGKPICWLSSVNLLKVSSATTHIARYLPSITHSKAPFTFVVQVSHAGQPCVILGPSLKHAVFSFLFFSFLFFSFLFFSFLFFSFLFFSLLFFSGQSCMQICGHQRPLHPGLWLH